MEQFLNNLLALAFFSGNAAGVIYMLADIPFKLALVIGVVGVLALIVMGLAVRDAVAAIKR